MTGGPGKPRAGHGVPGVVLRPDGSAAVRVWAPAAQQVQVHFLPPRERDVLLSRVPGGYHEAVIGGVVADDRYLFELDGHALPDPASRYQPEGVHGPSQVVNTAFAWTDDGWRGPELADYVLYELHVGTFTSEGTFDAIIPHLSRLRGLGVTALEIMPVAQFPGSRNWGYDGVYPYAAQASYGGHDGLRRLADAAHATGLALVLDVVYNHLGPEGNYLASFGPYFTDRYQTPWGLALNFDGPDSDPVREFFVQNALYWLRDYHVDALRLDAIHAIYDQSARHFLSQLTREVERQTAALGRSAYLIAESGLNDPRIVRASAAGGYGVHAQWNDDFHHALHVALTGEQGGYYADYRGVADLARSFNSTFVYDGQYSPFRRRSFGAPADDVPRAKFIVYAQNHDQVGNRLYGDRLGGRLSFEESKLAAAVVLLSPFVPMLWMGEEYGEPAPFLYFVSHGDAELIDNVRQGRLEEFAGFAWGAEPPDPQAPGTFERSRLDHSLRESQPGRTLLRFYSALLALRREHPAFSVTGRQAMRAESSDDPIAVVARVPVARGGVIVVHHFGRMDAAVPVPAGRGWQRLLDSASDEWLGPGSAGGTTVTTVVDERGRHRLPVRARSTVVLESA